MLITHEESNMQENIPAAISKATNLQWHSWGRNLEIPNEMKKITKRFKTHTVCLYSEA